MWGWKPWWVILPVCRQTQFRLSQVRSELSRNTLQTQLVPEDCGKEHKKYHSCGLCSWNCRKAKNHWGQKNKRLAGSHGDCLLCLPLRSVTALSPFQGIPLAAGVLTVDMASPRRALLSRRANEFLGSRFCSCFVLWHALPSGRSIVLPIKVIYGRQEAGRAPCPPGSLCPCWGWVMWNIEVELWLLQSGYLNSCRLLGKAIHTTHLPPSDHKYLELAAHSQYQLR